MKRVLSIFLAICLCLCLTGCAELLTLVEEVLPELTFPQMIDPGFTFPEFTVPEFTIPEYTLPDFTVPDFTIPDFTVPEYTVPQITVPLPTEPINATVPVGEHSELYIPGMSVEEVIEYFDEVCLDAEFVLGGDPSVVQKWGDRIYYQISGEYTEDDLAVLTEFTQWLNSIYGFPGIYEAEEAWQANLDIVFCDGDTLVEILGENFEGSDGGTTWWYTGDDVIYKAQIAYRNDIDQTVRNSVILEEIYNCLGPGQDTWMREDSIIYAGYSFPQELTEMDELILKLLYHPDMGFGMNAAQCAEVIRELYY